MKYAIVKHRLFVQPREVIDALEIYQNQQRKFYSFTYKELRGGEWQPLIRWDNLELWPHIDKFDQNGMLVEQTPFRSVSLHEVQDFVLMFRKGLMTLNIANL